MAIPEVAPLAGQRMVPMLCRERLILRQGYDDRRKITVECPPGADLAFRV